MTRLKDKIRGLIAALYTHAMLTSRVTDKNRTDTVIAESEARDQAQAEIIGKEYANGTIFGLWIKQENGEWMEF